MKTRMGFFFKDFEGLVLSLGALGAQSVPGTPSLRSRHPILSDFGFKLGPTGVPKRSQTRQKNSSKTDAKIDAIFEGPLKRCWLTLVVFLGPRTLKN